LKQLGRLEEAEAAYTRALQLEGGHVNALCNLGTIARERGELERAVELFEEALALSPTHFESHLNLGTTLRRMNRWAEALTAFEQALSLQPAHADVLLKLGATYYALGQIDQATSVYRQWIASDPKHPVPRHLLAGCSGEDVPERASDDFVRSSFEKFASHFDRSLARLQYRAPELVAAAIDSAIGAAQATLEVLDAGCGTGLCGPHLRSHARRLLGVDLSPAMLERAQARGVYDELLVAELTAFVRDREACFDLIACADTLVYFGSLDAVVGGFAKALTPNGCVVFTVERSEPSEAPYGYRMHPHGRYSHTEPYLRGVLEQAGFEVTQVASCELRLEAGKWVGGWVVTALRLP
jgi:predicted TPR repeat methyltransferase